MRKGIDEGLKKSIFGVAVLTPNYIADEKYWTKVKLDDCFNWKVLMRRWCYQYGIILQRKN